MSHNSLLSTVHRAVFNSLPNSDEDRTAPMNALLCDGANVRCEDCRRHQGDARSSSHLTLEEPIRIAPLEPLSLRRPLGWNLGCIHQDERFSASRGPKRRLESRTINSSSASEQPESDDDCQILGWIPCFPSPQPKRRQDLDPSDFPTANEVEALQSNPEHREDLPAPAMPTPPSDPDCVIIGSRSLHESPAFSQQRHPQQAPATLSEGLPDRSPFGSVPLEESPISRPPSISMPTPMQADEIDWSVPQLATPARRTFSDYNTPIEDVDQTDRPSTPVFTPSTPMLTPSPMLAATAADAPVLSSPRFSPSTPLSRSNYYFDDEDLSPAVDWNNINFSRASSFDDMDTEWASEQSEEEEDQQDTPESPCMLAKNRRDERRLQNLDYSSLDDDRDQELVRQQHEHQVQQQGQGQGKKRKLAEAAFHTPPPHRFRRLRRSPPGTPAPDYSILNEHDQELARRHELQQRQQQQGNIKKWKLADAAFHTPPAHRFHRRHHRSNSLQPFFSPARDYSFLDEYDQVLRDQFKQAQGQQANIKWKLVRGAAFHTPPAHRFRRSRPHPPVNNPAPESESDNSEEDNNGIWIEGMWFDPNSPSFVEVLENLEH
ncbi:hypothetical protein B0T20DRAFT_484435 [Sordaria brevicollis]|uniref:Uncharacterized protein n=1 Tax=Sordaria brevicollis TaxID=83679 RepID=A0AAE0NVA2_SORBR|nr:hypothetical protein B0T20DRAFT_484435 [Sordaria brevicollis]